MNLRQVIVTVFGRKAQPSPWAGLGIVIDAPVSSLPRDTIGTAAANAARALALHENARRRQASRERRPVPNETWWE